MFVITPSLKEIGLYESKHKPAKHIVVIVVADGGGGWVT